MQEVKQKSLPASGIQGPETLPQTPRPRTRLALAATSMIVAGKKHMRLYPGLLSNQGEKSINFYFIRVPLRKKVLKYGTPKPSIKSESAIGL